MSKSKQSSNQNCHLQNSSFIQQDLFGHVITFNFNKQGDSHKTILGAIVSIFIKIIMTVYVIYNVKKMLLYQDDKLYTDKEFLDLGKVG